MIDDSVRYDRNIMLFGSGGQNPSRPSGLASPASAGSVATRSCTLPK
jgi:hypothetical protein